MTEKVEDRGDVVTDGDETGETVDPKAAETKAAEEKEVAAKSEADAKVKAEADAKAQGAADQRAEADKLAAEKKISIPKERFDEAVGKARREAETAQKALAEANAKLRAAQGQVDADAVEREIDELEEKLEGARADNNKDLQRQLRTDIRMRQQLISDARAEAKAMYATAVAVEQINYNSLVTRMEIEHPELNPENEEAYSEDHVAELTELKEAFEAKGLGSTESLQKALKAVYRGGPKPADTKADPAAKAAADKAAADRKEAAVKKGVDTKAAQPADGKGVGADSDKAGKGDAATNASKMSDKDFDKLTKEELSKARGDSL